MRLRNPRDFFAGLMFLAFGLAFLVLAQDYQLGTARRMGPGYFPVGLAILLIAIGGAVLARSVVAPGEAIRGFAWGTLLIITASVVLFGFLVQRAGLVVAVAALTLTAGYASRSFRLTPALALALALAGFCVLIFVKGLGLPLPVLGAWFPV